MNLQNDSTKMNPLLQEHLNIWDKKILPHLPKQLGELAAQTGAVQRKRGIRSAQDLLKYCFCMPVLTFLSAYWQLPLVHLEFQMFLTLLGENVF